MVPPRILRRLDRRNGRAKSGNTVAPRKRVKRMKGPIVEGQGGEEDEYVLKSHRRQNFSFEASPQSDDPDSKLRPAELIIGEAPFRL